VTILVLVAETRLHSTVKVSHQKSVRRQDLVPTNDNIQQMVDAHNDHRAQVAYGKFRVKDGNLPTASNMMELVWNNNIAANAQAWADQAGAMNHSPASNRSIPGFATLGENLYNNSQVPHSPTMLNSWGMAVDAWFQESSAFGIADIQAYDNTNAPDFSQLIWAETTSFGCGLSTFADPNGVATNLIVCQYGPSGNNPGEPVYLPGDTATSCPISASVLNPGLCAAQVGSRKRHVERDGLSKEEIEIFDTLF